MPRKVNIPTPESSDQGDNEPSSPELQDSGSEYKPRKSDVSDASDSVSGSSYERGRKKKRGPETDQRQRNPAPARYFRASDRPDSVSLWNMSQQAGTINFRKPLFKKRTEPESNVPPTPQSEPPMKKRRIFIGSQKKSVSSKEGTRSPDASHSDSGSPHSANELGRKLKRGPQTNQSQRSPYSVPYFRASDRPDPLSLSSMSQQAGTGNVRKPLFKKRSEPESIVPSIPQSELPMKKRRIFIGSQKKSVSLKEGNRSPDASDSDSGSPHSANELGRKLKRGPQTNQRQRSPSSIHYFRASDRPDLLSLWSMSQQAVTGNVRKTLFKKRSESESTLAPTPQSEPPMKKQRVFIGSQKKTLSPKEGTRSQDASDSDTGPSHSANERVRKRKRGPKTNQKQRSPPQVPYFWDSDRPDSVSESESIVAHTPQPEPPMKKRRVFIGSQKKPVSPKERSEKKLRKCLFGCKKLYPRIARHYTGKKHGLSVKDATRLARSDKPTKTQSGRIRRVCPIDGCGAITCRMPQHLRNKAIHDLTEQEIKRYTAIARRFIKPTVSDLTPRKSVSAKTTESDQEISDYSNESRPSPGPSHQRLPQATPGPSHDVTNVPETEESTRPPESRASLPVERPREHKDRHRIPDVLISQSSKTYFRPVKNFWLWLQSDVGGGHNVSFSQQTANEVQTFFTRYGSSNLGLLNDNNVVIFAGELARNHKASTVLFYIRSLKRFLEYLYREDLISNARKEKLNITLNNIRSSYEKKRKQEKVETTVETDTDRLPAAARHAYFDSAYIRDLQASLRGIDPPATNFIGYRDYLLCTITLMNGHRPLVLRNLTIRDVRNATVEVVDGPEPENDRTYISMTVARHKTSKSHGAAIISLPVSIYRDLLTFIGLEERIFNLRPQSPVFIVNTGEGIAQSSQVNIMINRSYAASGAPKDHPQRFSATRTRKLLTSTSRDMDPSSGALVAAQLCHSLAQADAVYRLQARRSLSSRAVHHMTRAVEEGRERERELQIRAHEYLGGELSTIKEGEVAVEGPEDENREEPRRIEGAIKNIEKTKPDDMMWRRTALFGHLFGDTGQIKINSIEEFNREEVRQAKDDGEATEVIETTRPEQREDRKDKGKRQKDTSNGKSVKQLFGDRESKGETRGETQREEVGQRHAATHIADRTTQVEDRTACIVDRLIKKICEVEKDMGVVLTIEGIDNNPKDKVQSKQGDQVKGREDSLPGPSKEAEPEKERISQWVQEQISLSQSFILFDELPNNPSTFYNRLGNILGALDWSSIYADAQYWVYQSTLREMSRTTSFIKIAESLHRQLQVRFGCDIFRVLITEGPMPTKEHGDLPFVMILIASARIGGLFGSSVGPLEPPTGEYSNVDELRRLMGFTTVSHSPVMPVLSPCVPFREERGTSSAHKHIEESVNVAEDLPDLESVSSKLPDLESVSEDMQDLERVWEEIPVSESPSGRKRTQRHSIELEKAFRKIFSEEIETSAMRRKKTVLADIRRKMADVRALFPDLTEMQVRDKLWTMAMSGKYDSPLVSLVVTDRCFGGTNTEGQTPIFTAEPVLKETPKTKTKHPPSVEVAFRRIFSEELETSIAERRKLTRSEIRPGMTEVHMLFPELTELQVRDKLWTIASQESRQRRRDE